MEPSSFVASDGATTRGVIVHLSPDKQGRVRRGKLMGQKTSEVGVDSSSDGVSRSARREATQRVILDAAESHFASRGFAGASLRRVAADAGVSQPLLHHHFGSKAGLYEAVKRRFTDSYRSRFSLLAATGPLDAAFVSARMGEYLRFLQDNPRLSRLMAWSRLEGEAGPWGEEDELWQSMATLVRGAQSAGLIRPELHAELFIISCASTVQYWFDNREGLCRALSLSEDPGLDDRYVEQAVKVLLWGAGTSELRRVLGSS